MENSWGIRKILAGLMFVLIVAGCSGDGGIDGSGEKPKINIEGTAATGASIKNTKIFIKGKFGNRVQTSTDNDGKFLVDVASLSAPYVLKINLAGGKSLYSIALAGGVVNINPLTSLVAHNLFELNGRNLAADFGADEGFTVVPSEVQFSAVIAAINNLMQTAYQDYIVPVGFNFMSSAFNADQTAFDALLDHLLVQINGGLFSVGLIDPATSLVSYLIVNLNISFDFAVADIDPPSQPMDLTAIAASTQGVKIFWGSSTDNVGVSGYNLYRDDVYIATTSATAYHDEGLTGAVEYCYSVEAFDGEGNTSVKSDSDCATPLATADITAPAQVAGLNVTVDSAYLINVSWTPSAEDDVPGYHVYRKTDAGFIKIATTIASSYSDDGLDAETTYCYSIQAFDSALNLADSSLESCATTPAMIAPVLDTAAPDVSALPAAGDYDGPRTVILSCYDNGGSGCAATYYTTDGSEPTVDSTVYSAGIAINATAVLKYFSIDNAGNSTAVISGTYTIAPPPVTNKVLSITNNSNAGLISSDIAGIDCGVVCDASFTLDAQVILSATHPDGLTAVWTGCTSTVLNECTVQMSRDRSIHVSFVSVTSESASNDTFATSQPVLDTSIISGYFDAVDDADFYQIDVVARGTFKAVESHATATSFLNLYNAQFQSIAASGGCCGVLVNSLTRSLDPGTYYVRVLSDGVINVDVPYTLTLSGTVLGGTTPDVYEENDFFATATPVTGNGQIQGYLDTANDTDIFTFTVSTRSTFKAVESHATAPSFLNLYDAQFQSIAASGGCCGVLVNSLTRSLDPGIYYVRILSDSVSDLNVPYTLELSGTALGGTTPDVYEENDFFATATPVTDNASYQGYFDTANDADFYVLNVTVAGAFQATVAHATATSFATLYNDQNQALVSSGGCCGAAAHTLTYTVAIGTYYLRVLSNSVSDLNTPYTLSIAAIQ